jgi:type IV pilus assembly protein PilA
MKNIKISKKSNKRNIKKKRISNQRKGFTLIEIIAVIIIIGIISIIAVPAVINYISNAKKTTYTSYESSMKQAAENQILACVNGNEENCLIPNVIDEKQSIPLSSLVDQGYIDLMKNPESNDFCDKDLSYVEVKKIGDENFEYIACLYCGEYQTENASCTTYTLDGDEPTCGEITGASTRWTKERRTISVKCSDPTSGCTNSSFSKSFNTTTKEGSITIVDRSGRTKVCNVNVYVDKTKPTCEIKASGNYLEDYGWYILEADADLENMKDNESGLLTYGIGKSIQNRNYNKKTHMKLGSGITTVVGYVKDIAGNEGLCAQDIRVGT